LLDEAGAFGFDAVGGHGAQGLALFGLAQDQEGAAGGIERAEDALQNEGVGLVGDFGAQDAGGDVVEVREEEDLVAHLLLNDLEGLDAILIGRLGGAEDGQEARFHQEFLDGGLRILDAEAAAVGGDGVVDFYEEAQAHAAEEAGAGQVDDEVEAALGDECLHAGAQGLRAGGVEVALEDDSHGMRVLAGLDLSHGRGRFQCKNLAKSRERYKAPAGTGTTCSCRNWVKSRARYKPPRSPMRSPDASALGQSA
jgi:hypothetical protein